MNLDELSRLEAAATQGPWVAERLGISEGTTKRGDVLVADRGMTSENKALVVALRNSARELIAAARERDELRKQVQAMSQAAPRSLKSAESRRRLSRNTWMRFGSFSRRGTKTNT